MKSRNGPSAVQKINLHTGHSIWTLARGDPQYVETSDLLEGPNTCTTNPLIKIILTPLKTLIVATSSQ